MRPFFLSHLCMPSVPTSCKLRCCRVIQGGSSVRGLRRVRRRSGRRLAGCRPGSRQLSGEDESQASRVGDRPRAQKNGLDRARTAGGKSEGSGPGLEFYRRFGDCRPPHTRWCPASISQGSSGTWPTAWRAGSRCGGPARDSRLSRRPQRRTWWVCLRMRTFARFTQRGSQSWLRTSTSLVEFAVSCKQHKSIF